METDVSKLFDHWSEQEYEKGLESLNLAHKCAPYSRNAAVGNFVYAQGLISAQRSLDKEISGVIVLRNPQPDAPIGKRALMACLDQEKKAFSTWHCSLEADDSCNGWQNTQKAASACLGEALSLPAFDYIQHYAGRGIQPGEVFLPARFQLERVLAGYLNLINAALEQIGASRFGHIYRSSTEFNRQRSWVVRAKDAEAYAYAKTYPLDYVRGFVPL